LQVIGHRKLVTCVVSQSNLAYTSIQIIFEMFNACQTFCMIVAFVAVVKKQAQ